MVWFLLVETKTVPIGRARRELDAKAGLEGADYQRYRLKC